MLNKYLRGIAAKKISILGLCEKAVRLISLDNLAQICSKQPSTGNPRLE